MNLKEKIKSLTKKQIILGLLCVILFLSPSIFAWIHIYHEDHKTNDQELTVVLYDAEGTELGRETGTAALSDEASLLSIFSQLDQLREPLGATSNDALPSDVYVKAVLTQRQTTHELTCYFSIGNQGAVCLDENGNAYTIDTDINRRFLGTPYGEIFFATATPPVLLTIDGDRVLPSAVLWNYKVGDEVFLPTQRTQELSSDALYEITGELGLQFSTDPNQCMVTVKENGDVIFQDFYTKLSELTVDSGHELDVQISARWLKTDLADCYGDLSYAFRVRIKNPSEFSISASTVRPGGILSLSCTNVTAPEKIQFTSEQIPEAPRFYRDGALYRSLLVIPEDLKEDKIHLRVSYGASAQEFTLSVEEGALPEEYRYPSMDLSDSPLASVDIFASLKQILGRINSVFDSDLIYFQGNPADPQTQGFEIGYIHGSKVFWGKTGEEHFVAAGTEYRLTTDTPKAVTVWGNGIVTYVGYDELLGNFAVVDHGGGLLTWYGHLSMVSVSRGSVLRQGDTVGQTGRGDLSTGSGYLFLCSVHKQFVDPRILFDGSI